MHFTPFAGFDLRIDTHHSFGDELLGFCTTTGQALINTVRIYFIPIKHDMWLELHLSDNPIADMLV